MKTTFAVLLFLGLPASATPSEQVRRAAEVFDLSNSFEEPGIDQWLSRPSMQSAITLDGCEATIINVAHNLHADTFDASTSRFDLTRATLEPGPDGRAFIFSENAGTFSRPSGRLRFVLQRPSEFLIKEPSTEKPSLEEALAAPLRETISTAPFAVYLNDSMTSRSQFEALATAILDYQHDFCTLGS